MPSIVSQKWLIFWAAEADQIFMAIIFSEQKERGTWKIQELFYF